MSKTQIDIDYLKLAENGEFGHTTQEVASCFATWASIVDDVNTAAILTLADRFVSFRNKTEKSFDVIQSDISEIRGNTHGI